ncbi:hypothetical protein BDW67DRAFT_188408 [Aspergillus spinulosporus]
MKHISLVSEPEAAALYTLRAIQPNTAAVSTVQLLRRENIYARRQRRVHCVQFWRRDHRSDLIKIKTLEPLVLVEAAEGTGAVCGSLLLDGRFEELLWKRGIKAYDAVSLNSKEAAITYWQERVKPNFIGQFDNEFGQVEYFIPIAGAADDHSVPVEDGSLCSAGRSTWRMSKAILSL